MSRHSARDMRRAVWMILGLLAIPFLSVTATVLVADVASTTDPAAAAVGIPAVFGGIVTAALVARAARTVRTGVADAVATLLASIAPTPALLSTSPPLLVAPVAPRPSGVFVPAGVGRRGPPVVSA